MQSLGNPASFMGTALVPAVLVSACALLLLSFNNRIVAVLTRQRALHRELLEEGRKRRGGLAQGGVWSSFQSSHSNDTAGSSCQCAPPDAIVKLAPAAAEERYASAEWAAAIERQIRDLRVEAALIRAAVACLLLAILLFLTSGVTLAASTLSARAEAPAVVIFLCALSSFAVAILLMLTESFFITHPLITEEAHLRRIMNRAGRSQACLQQVLSV